MVRFLLATLLGILAIVSQLLVVILVVPGWPGTSVSLPALLGWQLLAALIAALFFAQSPQGKTREYRNGVFFHAFCICLFLPVAGQILFLTMLLFPILVPARHRDVPTQFVPAPEFNPALASRVAYGSGARLKVKLNNPDVSDSERVSAMIAMRSLPLHYTDDILRGLLSDPLEEVRLLAYGISNKAENEVTQKIIAASREMDAARTAAKKAALSSELAELHWELVYQNLVHGELRRHTLERVERYAHAALALNENNAAMWCLLGRCALLGNKPEQAEVFLNHAQKRNYPAQRLLPWLAEAAFMKREYDSIGPILAQLQDRALSPGLQSTVRYWTQ